VAQIEDKGQPQISRLKFDCLQSTPPLELFRAFLRV